MFWSTWKETVVQLKTTWSIDFIEYYPVNRKIQNTNVDWSKAVQKLVFKHSSKLVCKPLQKPVSNEKLYEPICDRNCNQ